MIKNKSIKKKNKSAPFFSVCIPQYNRTLHLIEACKVLDSQSFRDFEVCISDGGSTENRESDLLEYLESSNLCYVYERQSENFPYDKNLRQSISLAGGKYCLLHGNDDCLKSKSSLKRLYQYISSNDPSDVIVTNFEDWKSGKRTNRVLKTKFVGTGIDVAVNNFRNVAFVTGIVVSREKAQSLATNKHDGSEMYQMNLSSCMIASGGGLLNINDSLVRKDIQIEGEQVESYANKKEAKRRLGEVVRLPMTRIAAVVADGVCSYVREDRKSAVMEKIVRQLYMYTYPFWFFEFRRVKSLSYTIGFARGINPSYVCPFPELTLAARLRIRLLYLGTCILGLSLPIKFFEIFKQSLYQIAKKSR